MPCHAAILDKITTAKADQSVEDVLKLLKKSKRPYIAWILSLAPPQELPSASKK